MNPTSISVFIAGVSTLGLVSFLTGCGTTPTREGTTELPGPVSATAQYPSNHRLPIPVQTVAPEYPWDMTRAGISGIVNLHCLIDEAGKVTDMTVANASDDRFVKPALAAVKQWTFKPGMRDGVPVAMRVSVPVSFVLKP